MIILFDLDGTLIDSTDAILESFHNSFDVHKHPGSNDEQIKALIGYPLDIMYSKLGVEDEKVWDFVATYKTHYRKISRQKTTLLPFAKDAVLNASKIARLGVVTTKTARYSKELMEHFELMNYFEVLIGREDVENPKPDAEPILKALKQMNHKDEKCYMIGDTILDIEASKNAKIECLAVECGYDTRQRLESYGVKVFENALSSIKYLS
ncbi:MAG: HAD family hydrolase [Campylobacterota bacterium]|nr:HAD family hydrolase [Campylobacterota bacterium]